MEILLPLKKKFLIFYIELINNTIDRLRSILTNFTDYTIDLFNNESTELYVQYLEKNKLNGNKLNVNELKANKLNENENELNELNEFKTYMSMILFII